MISTANRSNTSDVIRALRQQLNLSQKKFAAKLGVSFKTVNRWENGHTDPSPMALKLIAELVRESGIPNPLLPIKPVDDGAS